jgi:hypothetical protein
MLTGDIGDRCADDPPVPSRATSASFAARSAHVHRCGGPPSLAPPPLSWPRTDIHNRMRRYQRELTTQTVSPASVPAGPGPFVVSPAMSATCRSRSVLIASLL